MKKMIITFFAALGCFSGINASDKPIGLNLLSVTRTEHLDPQEGEKIAVFVVETEHQDSGSVTGGRFSDDFFDYTCLHRAFNGASYIIQAILDGSRGKNTNKKLMEDMDKPFFGLLKFDAFVNPALYSSLCASVSACKESYYAPIADKIVYFNTDSRRAPVAGMYDTSYVSTDLFKSLQSAIKKNIKDREDIDDQPAEELSLYASLCFNSDYKKFANHIHALNCSDDYSFACVTTKSAKECGHGLTIVVHKVNGRIEFLCLDGFNVGIHGTHYQRCVDMLAFIINNPQELDAAIIRYVCAVYNPVAAKKEIEQVGLSANNLYAACYQKYLV